MPSPDSLPRRRVWRRLLKGVLLGGVAVALGLTVLVAFLWVEHRTPISLPALTGPFGVTRTIDVWTDDQRADPLAGGPGGRTELVVWMWLPSAHSTAGPVAYLPQDWQRAQRARQLWLFSLLMRDPAVIRPRSLAGGELPSEPRRFPIVILRAGLGALTTQYTALAESLASHGYVVVGFDAPYRTGLVVFPDGRVVRRPAAHNPETVTGDAQRRLLGALVDAWVSDVGFVLDRLANVNCATAGVLADRLDVGRVGVIGHSLGGATAAQFCQQDARCVAGIDLDGALHGNVVGTGLRRPFMFVLSDHGDVADPVERQIAANIEAVYDRLPRHGRVMVTVKDADHFMFSDAWLMRSTLLRRAFGIRLEPRRALVVITDIVRAFLDVHLKEASATSLTATLAGYPELTIRHDE